MDGITPRVCDVLISYKIVIYLFRALNRFSKSSNEFTVGIHWRNRSGLKKNLFNLLLGVFNKDFANLIIIGVVCIDEISHVIHFF